MQLGALKQELAGLSVAAGDGDANHANDANVAIDAIDAMWTSSSAGQPAVWALDPPRPRRREVVALVLLTLVLHGLLVLQVVRGKRGGQAVHQQQVVIEILRPPGRPAVIPPLAPRLEPPPAVVRKSEPRKAEPRAVAKLEPGIPPEKAEPARDLPALPVGDDPALAVASGKGTDAVAEPAPPPVHVAPPPVVAAHEGANYLKNPRPPYPELALRRGWEGDVLLRVRVSLDGRPLGVSIEKSSGRDVLDEAAVAAVRGWVFVPARVAGQTIAGSVTVPIVFHLQ
jgi:protein TonB